MTGMESVVNITFWLSQITPQDTLRPKACSASRAISIRASRVCSRNRRLRPIAAASASAPDRSAAPSAGVVSPAVGAA